MVIYIITQTYTKTPRHMKRIFTYTKDFTKNLYLKCTKPSPRITALNTPIPITDILNEPPVINPRVSKSIHVPFLNNSINVDYTTTHNKIIITEELAVVTKFTIPLHLISNGYYNMFSENFTFINDPFLIVLEIISGTLLAVGCDKFEKLGRIYKIPVVIIDDFAKNAPYTRDMSLLGNHTDIRVILLDPLDNVSNDPNINSSHRATKKTMINAFWKNFDMILKASCESHVSRKLRYANLNIQSLTKEQITCLIDDHVEKTFGFTGRVVLTSMTHNLDDIYDINGKHDIKSFKYLHNWKPIYEPDVNNARIDLVKTQTQSPIQTPTPIQTIYKESDIKYMREYKIIYVGDFSFDTFDYSNITNNKFIEKRHNFEGYDIIMLDHEHINNGFSFPRSKLLEGCDVFGYKTKTYHKMRFVDSPVYFSINIDDIVGSCIGSDMDLDASSNHILIGFMNSKYQKLYNGKYPIIELDVEPTVPNYSNINIMDNEDFVDGMIYYKTHGKQKAKFDNQNWIKGYIHCLTNDKNSKNKMF